MRLSISNIAWDVSEDEEVAQLLRRHHIDAIDIAPSKYFAKPTQAHHQDIARVRAWWEKRGVEITGMQALLFGTVGLNVFGPIQVQDAMLQHLAAVCRIGAGLGAPRLVFGSPKNRDRSSLTEQAAIDTAVSFFRRLAEIAQSYGVLICLEPNPPCTGANFMTTSAETADIVERIAHPAIRMQLDTGALTLNGEDAASVLDRCAHLIGHIHASEPSLLPLGDDEGKGGTDHGKVYAALQQHLPAHLVCVEMLATKTEPPLVALSRALSVAIHHYRPNI